MQSPLRNVRKAHGFTLQHVAAGVQVNPATLSRIERLEQIPSIDLAERLAIFFKGEISEMQILYPARFQSSQNQNGFKPQEGDVLGWWVVTDFTDTTNRFLPGGGHRNKNWTMTLKHYADDISNP